MKAQRSESHWEWRQVEEEGGVWTEFESLSQNGASAVSLMLISVPMEMRKKNLAEGSQELLWRLVTRMSYVALGQSHTFPKASFFSSVVWGKIACVTRWCPGWDKKPFVSTFQSQKCHSERRNLALCLVWQVCYYVISIGENPQLSGPQL